MKSKIKTVAFDFDGTIYAYKRGWLSENLIPGGVVPGIKELIEKLRNSGKYKVVIYSVRAETKTGQHIIDKWLDEQEIIVDDIVKYKPKAHVYIDDRAICFKGDTSTLYEDIENFESWVQK